MAAPNPTPGSAARWIATLLVTSAIAVPSARAVDVVDDFDGNFLDTDLWEPRGDKTETVGGGVITWSEGGNWGSGEIVSQDSFFLPADGQTTTITWVLAPASITADAGGDPNSTSLRYQFGIISSNQGPGRTEHWDNTTGGTWVDLLNITSNAPNSASGSMHYADDTKGAQSNATNLGAVSLTDWAWQSETRTFRLELTSTAFTWFDGDTFLGTLTWAEAGIDTEFANGYRVTTMGMNFNTGRGTMSIDRVAIVNPGEPPALLQSFGAARGTVTAGQRVTLKWIADPGATLTLDQGIGDVTGRSDIDGKGEIPVIPGDVDEPTSIQFTLTATSGAESETSTTSVTVRPRPELATADFSDEFDGNSIDAATWESRGPKLFSVEDGYLKWSPDGGGNWDHHEISTVATYPLPPAGATTTVRWVLGPGEITVDDNLLTSNNSIRYQIGLVSYHETDSWSRETWNNTTGGVWLDIYINSENPFGVGGGVLWADDRKGVASQYDWRASINVGDWDWQTEDHEFSIVVTAAGYTWYSGDDVIYAGTWNKDHLDNEFANGYRVLAGGRNYGNGDPDTFENGGRGSTSLQSVSLTNSAGGGGGGEPFEVVGITRDGGSAAITWESTGGASYDVERSAALAPPWETLAANLPSAGDTTTYTDEAASADEAFYRVAASGGGELPPVFTAGFEDGEDLSGWTVSPAGSTDWETGAPTSGPGAAHGGANVYATNLSGTYAPSAMTFLRSPPIDLAGRTGVTVEFYHWFDFEYDALVNFPVDTGEFQILDSTGFPVLLESFTAIESSGGWYRGTAEVPPEAGDVIQLEFGLFSDGAVEFAGWYLDDITVR